MEIKQFRLHNIGRFKDITIPLAPNEQSEGNVTVFVGNNGTGKTSLLKSLATSLSWLVARIKSETGSGTAIPELVIHNGKNSAAVDIQLVDQNNEVMEWRIARSRKGRKGEHSSMLAGATKLADFYRDSLSNDDNTALPFVAFYSVERVVIDVPLKIKGKHSFSQLDGYDKSLNQGVDFRRFFEWFREREDTENENALPQHILNSIETTKGKESEIWKDLIKYQASTRDRQLTAVRTAISQFMPGFSNLKVNRKPRLHMSIDKNDMTLNVEQLSQGEKSLMALIGDIARRLAMMNPELENPLEGDGIVLIDEVDMHLHPKWQRSLIKQLTSTFPKCQFVLTTHSPLVISDSKDVLAYLVEDEDELTTLPTMYGQDANSILLSVMDTAVRNEDVQQKLDDILDEIQGGHFEKSKELIDLLSSDLSPNNIELAKARLLLKKMEMKRAKSS
jgi:predicted ATP-binding protein involved in virulence